LQLQPELYHTAAQLNSAADQIVAIPTDATDPVAAPEIVAKVEQRLGPITLLINNAGSFARLG
jgi:short-subunit dehydrogenase